MYIVQCTKGGRSANKFRKSANLRTYQILLDLRTFCKCGDLRTKV